MVFSFFLVYEYLFSAAQGGIKQPLPAGQGFDDQSYFSFPLPIREAVVYANLAGVLAWRVSPYSCGTAPDFPEGSPVSPLRLLIREDRHQIGY